MMSISASHIILTLTKPVGNSEAKAKVHFVMTPSFFFRYNPPQVNKKLIARAGNPGQPVGPDKLYG